MVSRRKKESSYGSQKDQQFVAAQSTEEQRSREKIRQALSKDELRDLCHRLGGDRDLLQELANALRTHYEDLPHELPVVIDSQELARLDLQASQIESALRLVVVPEALETIHSYRDSLDQRDTKRASRKLSDIRDLVGHIYKRLVTLAPA